MKLQLIAGFVLLALLAGLAGAVKSCQGAREQLSAVELERDQARANAAAHLEAARLADERAATAEQHVADLAGVTQKVRVVYREAIRNDPSCAAWAAAPVLCPLGLPDAAGAPGPRLPADPRQPDP